MIENFDNELSFTSIRAKYEEIVDYLIRFTLDSIVSLRAKNYEDIVSLLKDIFNGIFLNSIESVEQRYYKYRGRHLKVFMNFGNGNDSYFELEKNFRWVFSIKVKRFFTENLNGQNFFLSH